MAACGNDDVAIHCILRRHHQQAIKSVKMKFSLLTVAAAVSTVSAFTAAVSADRK